MMSKRSASGRPALDSYAAAAPSSQPVPPPPFPATALPPVAAPVAAPVPPKPMKAPPSAIPVPPPKKAPPTGLEDYVRSSTVPKKIKPPLPTLDAPGRPAPLVPPKKLPPGLDAPGSPALKAHSVPPKRRVAEAVVSQFVGEPMDRVPSDCWGILPSKGYSYNPNTEVSMWASRILRHANKIEHDGSHEIHTFVRLASMVSPENIPSISMMDCLEKGRNKPRFEISMRRCRWAMSGVVPVAIRAIQGHSAPIDLKTFSRRRITSKDLPFIYHGCKHADLQLIVNQGLLPGHMVKRHGRAEIDFSPTRQGERGTVHGYSCYKFNSDLEVMVSTRRLDELGVKMTHTPGNTVLVDQPIPVHCFVAIYYTHSFAVAWRPPPMEKKIPVSDCARETDALMKKIELAEEDTPWLDEPVKDTQVCQPIIEETLNAIGSASSSGPQSANICVQQMSWRLQPLHPEVVIQLSERNLRSVDRRFPPKK